MNSWCSSRNSSLSTSGGYPQNLGTRCTSAPPSLALGQVCSTLLLTLPPSLPTSHSALGVAASSHAKLYIIMSPSGPYFPTGFKPLSVFAECDAVRSWPGGTGAFKLGINYAPTFKPQREAAKLGYQQILWILGDTEEDRRITEAGQMNFFAVVERDDGAGLDVITPPLDGTILPGVTRASILELCEKFNTQHSLRQFAADTALVSDAASEKLPPQPVPSTQS